MAPAVRCHRDFEIAIEIEIGLSVFSIAIPISISMVWRTITLYPAEFRIIRISPSN